MAGTFVLYAQTVDPSTGAVTDHGAWDGVELDDADEVLNGVGSLSWTAGALDSYVTSVVPVVNAMEVRLERNGTPVFAGPIRTIESDGSRLTFRADSLEGYAGDRYLDRAQGRTNLLTNPGFESGLTGWGTGGADVAGLTASADTAQHVLGTQAAKLVRTDANKDSFLYQQFSITGTAIGSLVTVAAWFRLQNSGFVGPAVGSFGVYVNQQAPLTTIINPDPDDLAQLDGTVDRDTWDRVEAITRVPPLATVTVEVRLYGVGGTIWWDAVQAVLMESVFFDNVDIATIVHDLWAFAADTANGKSALGFTYSTSAVGVTQVRAYQHADHIPLATALQEFAEADDGLDWWITPARVVSTGSPRRGTDRTGTLTLTLDSNCRLDRFSHDGHQQATSVTVLGTGSGPDREEANASVSGVTTMQRIVTPRRNDPPIDTLAPTATRELALTADPTIWEVQVTDPTLCGVGDTLTFSAPSGVVGSYLATSGTYRVVRKTWHPKADTASLTLNPA